MLFFSKEATDSCGDDVPEGIMSTAATVACNAAMLVGLQPPFIESLTPRTHGCSFGFPSAMVFLTPLSGTHWGGCETLFRVI
jgi:hypothetical protein